MSASAASTPAATSPASTADVKPCLIRKPSLVMKPVQTPPAGSPPPNSAGTLSLTSKEWIIPPRPKPGRKPATDTPPSKRKAQNRAAQRAFRERRAARVNELEDQIKQIEDENDKETDTLRAQVCQLEKEVEQYRADLILWVDRCRRLETELNTLKTSRSPRHNDAEPPDTSVGCGNCTLESRCQCIDDAFDTLNAGEQPTTEKRPHSPLPTSSNKRIKVEPQELEIDFTNMFSRRPASHPDQASPTSATVADPCGFCSDGTPCICAEMAAEQEAAHSVSRPQLSHIPSSSRLPRLSAFTPPPSEGDVSVASTSIPPTAPSSTNPCANGPGTCAQCQADPNSTLFCKSLAASRSQSLSQASGGGCCGGRGADGGCCQSKSQPSSTDAVPLPPRNRKTRSSARNTATSSSAPAPTAPSAPRTVTLTCADAYTTLSRHPAYERASAEITSWMPKLYASDSPGTTHGSTSPAGKSSPAVGGRRGGVGSAAGAGGGPSRPSRPAMEIDAANVMAVLRDFDRRFGREG